MSTVSNILDLQHDTILAFRQGDRAAFNSIYLQLRKPLITFCSYMVPIDDAQDITSDVFLKLWKSHGQWDNISNIKAFLYMAARNACYDFMKVQKRRSRREQQVMAGTAQDEDLVQQAEIESELINLIRQEIDKLPDNCRTVFSMSHIEGLPNAEIAQQLGISDKTVRNLKSMALKTIRKNLRDKGLPLGAILLLIQLLKRLP